MSTAHAEFESIQALKDRLGVHEQQLHNWIQSGELRAHDVSKKGSRRPMWRVSEIDLQEFLSRRANDSGRTNPGRNAKAQSRRRRKAAKPLVEQFY